MQYHVIIEQSPSLLKDRVNEMIVQGWEPVGGFTVFRTEFIDGKPVVWCSQAVIRHQVADDEQLVDIPISKSVNIIH